MMREPDRPVGGDGSRLSAVLSRVGSGLLWGVLPAVVLLLVAAYIAMATIGHVNPPVVPVEGLSMRPTLQAGDLVFLKGVDPTKLRKGDIIAVSVPTAYRKQYNLPAHIVHRIVKISHGVQGLTFTTKGDANAGPDVFPTRPNDVIGEVRFVVPGLGYPFLFFHSRQGEIFLVAAAALALLYFGLGLVEDRRITVEGTAVTMQNVLDETNEVRLLLERARSMTPPGGQPPELERLADDVSSARAASDETARTMRELVGAISEYGEHLRSHTAVMKNLAAATEDLRRATTDLGSGSPALIGEPRPPLPPGRGGRTWRPLLDFPVLSTVDFSRTEAASGRVGERLDRMSRRLDERTRRFEQLRRDLEM